MLLVGILSMIISAPARGSQATDELSRCPGTSEAALDGSMTDFLRAYNTGKPEALEKFVARWFGPTLLAQYSSAGSSQERIQAAATRIHDLYRLYGELSVWRVDDSFEPVIVWARAPAVDGWIGFQRQEGATTGAWERLVVWRIRPPDAPFRAAIPSDAVPDSLDAYLAANAAEDRFSGVVLVARGDSLIFHRGYGMADRKSEEPIGLDHRFNIGSVSKMFTGVAALHLVAKGQLSLSDMLSRYVPEYPREIGDSVTIRDLLTHASGIELDDVEGFAEAIRDATTMDEILSVHLRFLEPAGYERTGEFNYTNEGIALLGIVIERASGKPWAEALHRHVFGPAGMSQTTPRPPEDAPVAVGYTALSADGEYGPGPWRPAWPLIKRHAQPAGQHWTTADDLWRFWRALHGGRLLERAQVAEMVSPQIDAGGLERFDLESAYGYTIQIETREGRTHVGHAGVIPGYSAVVRHYPDTDWTVIVVANIGDTAAHVAAEHVEQLLMGSGRPIPRADLDGMRER